MPYFIILLAYAVLFIGLIAVALLSLAFNPLLPFSGYVICGALGTIPGFVFGNLLFWAVMIAVGALIPENALIFKSGGWSEGVAIGFGLLVVAGLVAANIFGCLLGFLGGVFAYARFKRTTPANKPMQSDDPESRPSPPAPTSTLRASPSA